MHWCDKGVFTVKQILIEFEEYQDELSQEFEEGITIGKAQGVSLALDYVARLRAGFTPQQILKDIEQDYNHDEKFKDLALKQFRGLFVKMGKLHD